MIRLPLRCWYRRMAMIALVCASAVIASDAPPATLPREFLEQLPLLMQLNKEEFELLLMYIGESNPDNRRNDGYSVGHTNESAVNSGSSKNGEQNED